MSALGMGGALHSGTSAEWWTPPHIFDALGLDFSLDPCAPAGGVPWVPAREVLSIDQDGLSCPWLGRVWLNPPYGRETPRWVDRLIAHGDGVALVFARVDAAWAQRALTAAGAVCFIAGRLSFLDGRLQDRVGHNAAASSMLLGFGEECSRAVATCGLGVVARVDASGHAAERTRVRSFSVITEAS
jgi:DNA N-6-adenine-methyltransferase (Dam)